MNLSIDLAYLCRPHPAKWFLPLKILQEDGQTLFCVSHLGRTETRKFLRDHHLLELFDDILYTDPHFPLQLTKLSDLPPLALHLRSRLRLTAFVNFSS